MKTTFLAVALMLVGCTRHETKPDVVAHVSAPLPLEGKRSAPVAIDADLTESSGKLTLRFERPAEKCSVQVSGVDGLTITSSGEVLTDAKVSKGETKTFDVKYSRGPGRTHLVVSVRGQFDGAPLARVVTFAMGDGPLQQNGTRLILDDGDAIKVMQVP
jgi:hypothetical protein